MKPVYHSICMKLGSIFCLVALTSCSVNRETKTASDFERYLNSLQEIKLPVSFDTKTDLITYSPAFDTALFSKYKHQDASAPYGRLAVKDSVITIIEIVPGDVLIPLICTFDMAGNKLDSLNPYNKAGADMGYESYEFVTLNKSNEIIVRDSTWTWDLNADGTDILEETESLSVDTVIYRVERNGRIIKTKG